MHNRHPSPWPHRACPDAPLPREAWEPWRNEKLPSLMCREETRWCKEETMWRQEADLLRSTSEAVPEPAGSYWRSTALPAHARVPGRRAHSPAADAAHMRQPGAVPCSWLAAMVFPDFPSTGSSQRGSSRGKSLPFLRQPPAKKQVLLPAPLPGAGRAAPTRGCKPSPLARAGAFPSRVVSQQTCCWPWRGSRAAQVCRCYPSLPPPAGSGHTPILEGGSFPPSWRCRGARASEQLPGSRWEEACSQAGSAREGLTHSASIWYAVLLNKIAPALLYRLGPSGRIRTGSLYGIWTRQALRSGKMSWWCHLRHPAAAVPPSLGKSGISTACHAAEELTSWSSSWKKRVTTLRGVRETEKDLLERGREKKGVVGTQKSAGEWDSQTECVPPPLWLGLMTAEGITTPSLSSWKISWEM